MKYAAYVHQFISLDSRGKLSPYQMLYGQKPDISHLKQFGTLAVVQKSETKRKDNALHEREPRQALSKGEIVIFVGCGVVRRGRVIPSEKVLHLSDHQSRIGQVQRRLLAAIWSQGSSTAKPEDL